VVEPCHLCPATGQFGGIKARAARRVLDPLARHVAQQRQAGWPVIAGVAEPVLGMVEKLISEYAASRLAPHLGVHAA
jgi:hypothetical protein